MAWIFFSLASALVQSSVNIIDKFVISNLVKKPIVQLLFFGVMSLIIALCMFVFHIMKGASGAVIIYSMISGAFYAGMNLFYFKAVMSGEVSSVIPLFKLSSLFVAILAAMYLGEAFTPVKYIAVLLLLCGSVVINYRKSSAKLTDTVFFVVLAAIFIAINQVMNKALLVHTDYWTLFGWGRIGTVIFVIPFFCIYWKDFKSVWTDRQYTGVALMSLSEVLNLTAVLLLIIATSSGFVTLTNALMSLQPLFVLIFVVLISVYLPRILKEEIKGSTIVQKIIAIVLLIAGAWLIV